MLRLLIASLLLTLLARLSFVQLLDEHKPQQSAGLTHLGSIVVPAPRGEILDSRGRVLVGNRSTHVLTVDRSALDQQDDHGAAVLARLAPVLGTTAADLRREITPCGSRCRLRAGPASPTSRSRWPPASTPAVALAVSEHAELFPGVSISTQTVLDYPGGAWPRTCSATPVRWGRPTRRRTRRWWTPTPSGAAGWRSPTTRCCAASTASSGCSWTRAARRSARTPPIAARSRATPW